MAKHLLRLEEWQEGSGRWTCADCSDLLNNSSAWWKIMRMLDMTPQDYINFLITKFKPDHLCYLEEPNLLLYSWGNQSQMRVFKNWVNAEARKRSYYI